MQHLFSFQASSNGSLTARKSIAIDPSFHRHRSVQILINNPANPFHITGTVSYVNIHLHSLQVNVASNYLNITSENIISRCLCYASVCRQYARNATSGFVHPSIAQKNIRHNTDHFASHRGCLCMADYAAIYHTMGLALLLLDWRPSCSQHA